MSHSPSTLVAPHHPVVEAFEAATHAYYLACFRLATDFPPDGVAETQRNAESDLFDSTDPAVDTYVQTQYIDRIEALRLLAMAEASDGEVRP